MKTKAKNTTQGAPLELSRIVRGVCASHSTNLAIEKIEKSLRLLGIQQCPACGEPQYRNPYLGGICGDCWADNDGLPEIVDFSGLASHEIARCWRNLDIFDLLASGREQSQYAPRHYRIAMGIEATLGNQLADALHAQDHKAYWSPCRLRWQAFVGLVPFSARVFPAAGDFKGWRCYWAGKGKEKALVPLF